MKARKNTEKIIERPRSRPSTGGGLFSCFSCVKAEEEEIHELDLSHCSLDNVPTDIFAYERTLEDLYLNCNNIRDLPRQLFQCQELKILDLSDNDVQHLPPALSSLSQLVKLHVNKNALTEIPDTVKQLKQLTVLDASANPLQKIPEGCTQLLSIAELYLNDCFLEFLPANFGRLSKLKILELRDNGLSTLPKSLSRLVQLQRLDLGQNDMTELPEVVGSLNQLQELWIDGNRIQALPPMIGNLKKLNHLEAGFNQLETISESIANCQSLVYVSLSTNDLRSLPDGIGALPLVETLKVDDNQLEIVPNTIGQLANLEELILSQNYLVNIPSSIGLCRKLHTLNIDDNDVEYLPKELGSCISLKILSVHGNQLTSLPAELDHITNLAVLNLTANRIQNLPVSFVKLRNITALWLSENQTKPLIQLNQDTDLDTGQKVLTNFMLPQHPDHDGYADNISESGSFHASIWEEEHAKKSQVKWAGDGDYVEENHPENRGNLKLRREPTPFPKEMRAMAKRAQKIRSKVHQDIPVERKRSKEQIGRRIHDVTSGFGSNNDVILIKEAKVTKPQASPIVSEKHIMSVFQDEKSVKEQLELQQFEELERSLNIAPVETGNSNVRETTFVPVARKSPDKTSRDSGVITPSDGSTNSPENVTYRKPSDPLPQAPEVNNGVAKVQSPMEAKSRPPPYHIAAEFSKNAKNFPSPIQQNETSEQHSYENQLFGGDKNLRLPDHDTDSRTNINDQKKVNSDAEAALDVSHANHLRTVSKQLYGDPRTRQSVTGIPMLSNSRPGSYASPHSHSNHSPLSRLPTPISRPSSQMSFSTPHNQARPGSLSIGTPPPNGHDLTPRSATPASKVSLESNGLLNTIEKAVHSDDEGPGWCQPNYENVSENTNIGIASKSKIPQRYDRNHSQLASGDCISTSQFVMPSRSHEIKMAHASTTKSSFNSTQRINHRQSKLPQPVLSPK